MAKFPKILVVSNYNDYHSVRPEAEIFLSLVRKGYDVTIMTYGGSKYAQRFVEAGISVINHHPSKKYDPESIRLIRKVLIEGKHDVLHLYNNKAITNGLIAAKRLPITKIGYRGSTLNFQWFNPYNYLKHLNPSLDYVICNSAGVANCFRKHPFFNSEKAVVINKGHELSWYADVQPLDLRVKYDILKGTPIFILVATDRTMKGVKYLCEAVNLLPSDVQFKLFLIGGGMDSKKYDKLLSKGKHGGDVIRLAHTDQALSFVAGADVFVLPSIKGESITKAVLESMSLGKCPLITDIPGNVELVHHEKNGIIVSKANAQELADAIITLCKDQDLIKTYGEAAKQHIANRLSHQQTVEGYMALYERIRKRSSAKL